MKLAACAFAATVIASALSPTMASAQDVRIRMGDRGMGYDHGYGYRDHRAEYRGFHDRGWHRGWGNRDRVVVIKERRRHRWD